jgi:hypothetical protein
MARRGTGRRPDAEGGDGISAVELQCATATVDLIVPALRSGRCPQFAAGELTSKTRMDICCVRARCDKEGVRAAVTRVRGVVP